jgi:hypothetical protein
VTSFGLFQAAAQRAGLFMCDLCFGSFPPEEAWRDEDGQAWTICVPCRIEDEAAVARKLLAEQDEDEGDEDAESGDGADGGDDG